jgi:hypothetical protein
MKLRNKFITLTLLLLSISVCGNVQASQWAKVYNYTTYNGIPNSIWPTGDGNYNLNSGTLFAKLDPSGNKLWAKYVNATQDPSLSPNNFSINTTPGGFLLQGATKSYGTPGGFNIVWAKYDSAFNPIYQKVFGGIGGELGTLWETTDGGLIFTGGSNSYSGKPSTYDMLVFKTNTLGAITWKKAFNFGTSSYGSNTILEINDGFLIPGCDAAGDVLLKLDKTTGNVIWSRHYNIVAGTPSGASPSIIPTADGNYLLITNHGDISVNNEIYLIKIDPSGNIIWSYKYHSNAANSQIAVTNAWQDSDGSFTVTGDNITTDAQYNMQYKILIIKVTSNGNTMWQKTIGGAGITSDTASINKNPAGDITVSGFHYPNYTNSTESYALFSKLDPTTLNPLWSKTVITSATDGVISQDSNQYIVGGVGLTLNNPPGNVYGLILDTNGNYTGCSYVQDVVLANTIPSITTTGNAMTQSNILITERINLSSESDISIPVLNANLISTDICTPNNGTPCNADPAETNGTPYPTLQNAFDTVMSSGSNIKARQLSLTENISWHQNITATLTGGYSCDFSSTSGFTTVKSLTISAGMLNIAGLTIQ